MSFDKKKSKKQKSAIASTANVKEQRRGCALVKPSSLHVEADKLLVHFGIPLHDAASEEAIAAFAAKPVVAGPFKNASISALPSSEPLNIQRLVYGQRELRSGRIPDERQLTFPALPPVSFKEINEFIFRKFAIEVEWHQHKRAGGTTLFTTLPLSTLDAGEKTTYNTLFHYHIDYNLVADEILKYGGFPVQDALTDEEAARHPSSANHLGPFERVKEADIPSLREAATTLAIQLLVYQHRELRQCRVPENFTATSGRPLADMRVTLDEVNTFILKKLGVQPKWYMHCEAGKCDKLFTRLPLSRTSQYVQPGFNTSFIL